MWVLVVLSASNYIEEENKKRVASALASDVALR